MDSWKELKAELMRDPEFKQAYDELEPQYQLTSSLIKARMEKGLTQTELAERAGISQVMVARLEGGESNPTLKTLYKVSKALDKQFVLR